MKICSFAIFLLSFLLAPFVFAGSDTILIRAKASPEDPWLGQQVTIHVDVLATEGWAQIKTFRDIQLDSGYLMRFETQGVRINETISGKSYSGQRYEFFFFPGRSGNVIIPEIPLDIEVKSWGTKAGASLERDFTKPLTLNVQSPPDKQAQGKWISTTDFSAEQKWEPAASELQVGDAISRTVSRRAANVPAMLFPPLSFTVIEGMQGYHKDPEIQDKYDRGELSGSNVESITYVAEQPGDYEFPDLVFSWWNVKSKKMEKLTLPGRSFTVSGVAATDTTQPDQNEKLLNIRFITSLFLISILLFGILFRSRESIKHFFTMQLRAYRESEWRYFHNISTAAHRGDPKKALRTTMQWLDQISTGQTPARLDHFLERYGDTETQRAAEQLMSLHASDKQIKLFYKGLVRARKKWLNWKKHRKTAETLLPEIGLTEENTK